MKIQKATLGFYAVILAVVPALAAEVEVTLNRISDKGVGEKIGKITLSDTEHGLLIFPDLDGLKPGVHGFHVHEKPDCGPGMKQGALKAGVAAGGHFDPAKTGNHGGPYGEGHLGDLPALFVDGDGKTSSVPLLAPRLKLSDIRGRALMVHEGGDTYSDKPELGGGGARVACGVIP